MRSRLKWVFAGLTALVVGYALFRRRESKRISEEQRDHLEREAKLKAIAASMKQEEDESPSALPGDLPNHPHSPGMKARL